MWYYANRRFTIGCAVSCPTGWGVILKITSISIQLLSLVWCVFLISLSFCGFISPLPPCTCSVTLVSVYDLNLVLH